jgi:ribosomal protein S18 acetylase RimI-like enzyme
MTATGPTKSTPPPPRAQQPSIRSFFQPKQPVYAAPPGIPIASTNSNENTPPQTSNAEYSGDVLSKGASTNESASANSLLNGLPMNGSVTPNGLPMNGSATPLQSPNSSSLPSSTQPSSLPPDYSIEAPQPQHIQPLHRINSLLLPIPYPDSFYNAILSPPSGSTPVSLSFSRVVLHHSPIPPSEPKVIGSLICRLDPSPPPAPSNHYSIYLQSLTLLSPHRHLGLATQLLDSVIGLATSTQVPLGVKIEGLYAHVWVENTDALEWYLKRGFEKGELVEGYYRRLRPQEAWLLRRRITVKDHMSSSQTQLPTQAQSQSIASSANKNPIRPPPAKHTASFQDRRPDREWNDLPEDVLLPVGRGAGDEQSKESSRSSSRSGVSEGGTARGKKKRSYPAAAFGGGV